jgi:dihydropteroate synthase
VDSPATEWVVGSETLDISRGILMGVLNVTPDSFSDGGDFLEPSVAIEAGERMIGQGATVIDVGGESSRPGATAVSQAEELRRVLPVVEALAAVGIIVSIDTTKPKVAEAAIEAGALIVNDISGFGSPDMVQVASSSNVGTVVMHMQGTPRTMQENPTYDDVVDEVRAFLDKRANQLATAGVREESIALDPGIGFGKSPFHNLELINRLTEISALGHPVLIGTSRKSTLRKLTGEADRKRRDGQTAITTALAFERGARIFRVHDVLASRDALRIVAAIVAPDTWEEWQQD